jgi:phage terminase Nu1 subunit (DNA packaging protein)
VARSKTIAEVIDGKVYVLQAGTPIYVKTADVCAATGKSNQWIGQLVSQGTLNKSHTPFGAMFDFRETMKAYIEERVGGEDDAAKRAEAEKIELQKQKAEAALKAAKAKKENLMLKELEGKMHNSEDVEAMTTDLIFNIRGALVALPGRLAVAVAGAKDPAEVSSIITTEINEVMDELVKINNSGATIMLVTHDAKVAARCTRVLYIVDGNIQGEYELGAQTDGEAELKKRERELTNWLMEMGW